VPVWKMEIKFDRRQWDFDFDFELDFEFDLGGSWDEGELQ